MRLFLIISLVIIFPIRNFCYSANPEDSVKYYFERSQSTLRIDSALIYAQKAVDFVNTVESDSMAMPVKYNLGVYYWHNGRYQDGIEVVEKVRETAIRNKDTLRLIKCTNFIANMNTIINDFEQAIEEYQYALGIAKEIQDSFWLSVMYNNIGRSYLELKDNSLAKEFLSKSLKISKAINTPEIELVYTYGNLAECEENIDTAITILNEALQIAKTNDDVNNGELYLLYQLGKIHFENENYPEALKVYTDQYELAIGQKSYGELVTTIPMLADVYEKLNDLRNAKRFLQEYESLKEDYRNALSDQYIFKVASRIFNETGEFEKAYAYLQKANSISDSLYQKDIDDKFVEYNAKFKAEEKDKEIAQQKLDLAQQELQIQKQKSQRQRTLIGSILALLLSAIAFQYYLQKQKRKKQAAEHQLQLQQAETESLKKLDELKTQFFTNVSHELRTPLTLINGPLENALQNTKDKSQQKSIATAFKNSKKLSNLVNEILDFSKLEAGKLEVQLKKVELNHFIKRIFTAFESMAEIRGIKLNFNSNIPHNLITGVDDNKLEKIINNLVSNAIKFTKRNGQVSLKVDCPLNSNRFESPDNDDINAAVNLSVSDTGSGIHSEDLPYVFERFYQSQQKSESLQGGTGIGLALSKELAELMNGKLTAESTWQEGSTFILNIPVTVTVADVSVKTDSDEFVDDDSTPAFTPLFINGKKPKILIVEDNYEMSRYLNELLSEEYNCTIAHDGREALKKLKQQSFDLISADVMMPNMDGFTFRKEVNKDERFKGIPFIMLTARAIEEDKLKGLQLGVDDYITKPFSKLELKARIHNLLLNKIQRDEWKQQKEEQEETPNVELSFIQQVEMIVLKNIDDTDFKVNDLAEAMNYSQRQLSRILKKHIGLSPVAYILEIRLQKARQLLEQKKYDSVKEVQFEVGIDSASYFTSKFKERFGKSPSEYA